jgi:hypothetical protein
MQHLATTTAIREGEEGMKIVEAYECENCGTVHEQKEYIHKCRNCGKEICKECHYAGDYKSGDCSTYCNKLACANPKNYASHTTQEGEGNRG